MPKDGEYEFHEAADGQKGFEKFVELRPDVTFLDITMPVMDGIESLEAMKKADKDAVVIMCTADIQPKSILKVVALGALTVIKKPLFKRKSAKGVAQSGESPAAARRGVKT